MEQAFEESEKEDAANFTMQMAAAGLGAASKPAEEGGAAPAAPATPGPVATPATPSTRQKRRAKDILADAVAVLQMPEPNIAWAAATNSLPGAHAQVHTCSSACVAACADVGCTRDARRTAHLYLYMTRACRKSQETLERASCTE